METKISDQDKFGRHKFFFETPLYTSLKKDEIDAFKDVDFSDFVKSVLGGDVDAYSPQGFETTYQVTNENMRLRDSYANRYSHLLSFGNFHAVTLMCKRKGDILRFIIFVDENNESIVKIGQYPSLADLQYAEIGKKYDKILSKEDLRDLKKAIGLSAHGAGAGSLVYLRRIFEDIIWKSYEENKRILGREEISFKKERMDEKVSILKEFLPEQLFEMKEVYTVLSKGIHELSEEECLAYFPALRLSIELILEQKIEREAKKKRDNQTKKELMSIAQSLKNP